MDTDSFIVYIKTDDIYKEIAANVETKFDNSNYDQIDHYQTEKENLYLKISKTVQKQLKLRIK